MKHILLGLVATLFLVGCSADKPTEAPAEPALVVGKSIADLKINDQLEKEHTLQANTTKVIFAFSDDMGHVSNDYFATKEASYLADNNTQFVADISAAPSLIQSMFIKPGLEKMKHTVLVLSDKAHAAPYKSGVDINKLLIAHVANGTITKITTLTTQAELIAVIEAK